MRYIAARFSLWIFLSALCVANSKVAFAADDKAQDPTFENPVSGPEIHADKTPEMPTGTPAVKAPEKTPEAVVEKTPEKTPEVKAEKSPEKVAEKSTPVATPAPTPSPAPTVDKYVGKPSDKTIVGFFTAESPEVFEKKIKPFFETYKSSCKTCEIINLTPYDSQGHFIEKDLVERLRNAPPEITLFYIAWNRKYTDQSKDLVQALSDKVNSGRVIVSPTGYAPEKEASMPLSRTVMGQAKDIIILGELGERDRLQPPQSYFGPEMLTAIRPPKEYMGQGMAPLYFVSRLSAAWNRHKPADWLQHFKTKKMKSRKIWMEVDDLLSR